MDPTNPEPTSPTSANRSTPKTLLPNFLTKLWRFLAPAAIFLLSAAVLEYAITQDLDLRIAEKLSPVCRWIQRHRVPLVSAPLVLAISFAALIMTKWFRAKFHQMLANLLVLCCTTVLYRKATVLFSWTTICALYPTFHTLFANYKQASTWLAAVIGSLLAVCLSSNMYIVTIAMIILWLILASIYCHEFHSAFRPSGVWIDLAHSIRHALALMARCGNWLIESVFKSSRRLSPGSPGNSESDSSAIAETVKSSAKAFAATIINNIADNLSDPRKIGLLERISISRVLTVFTATVVLFAFEYVALYKINPDSFVFQDGAAAGVFQFLGFSLSTMTTASVSRMSAVGNAAQLLCHLQVICGVVLFTIIISFVMTAAGERHEADMLQSADALRELAQELRCPQGHP